MLFFQPHLHMHPYIVAGVSKGMNVFLQLNELIVNIYKKNKNPMLYTPSSFHFQYS